VGDALVERSEKFVAHSPYRGVVRMGAQEKQDLVKTNQRGGIG